MTLRASLKQFSPAGLSDALDAMNVFQGACAQLINLIPDPNTRNLWKCRPAQTVMTEFAGFTNPGFISALRIIGDIAYGMIASDRFVGKDEPFSYNILAGTFNTISGVTNANTPNSPPTSGAWTPPCMELVGVRMICTHPGFNGVPNFFGYIDTSNPAAPTWTAGNTTTTPLPFVPNFVANYQGSAVFAVNEAAYFTDPLSLVQQAANVLTFFDNVPIVAMKGLGLNTQLGGITQSLIVFKSNNAFQVKGSFFTSPSSISRDGMNYAVGTLAPLSLFDSPIGMGFVAPDGLRFVDFQGNITEPVGHSGDGVNVPFLNALVPSRISAACNASTIRFSVQNAGVSGQPTQEYWLHLNRKPAIWSGPHTFAPSLAEAYGTKFITAPTDVDGALYMSETVPSTISVYEENGAQLEWTMSTVMFADYGFQGVYNFNEMTINIALDPTMISWSARIVNSNLQQYDNVDNLVPNTVAFWDSAIWDQDVWDGIAQGLTPRRIEWSKDVTTSRAQVILTGGSAGGVIIGELKYMQGNYQYVPQNGI